MRLGAVLRGHPRARKRNGEVYFEVPVETADALVMRGQSGECHDAWARAALWPAMEAGYDLFIHGRLSRRLLANLQRYQEIVCRWWPEYHPVRIQADEEVGHPDPAHPDGGGGNGPATILAFSGGLDSIESLVGHARGWRGRNTLNVRACLFVHGFDIPLGDPTFSLALRRAQRVTSQFSTPLWAVRTNLKRMLPEWEMTFSTAVATVLSLFEPQFPIGLLASSTVYEDVHWIQSRIGSTPLTDPLLSSESFRIVHDSAVSRLEKTAALAESDFVWRDLRVCWQGQDLSRNCGRCEKCQRQMLCMMACGVRDFSAFEQQLSASHILATHLPSVLVADGWRRTLAYAVEHGRGDHEVFRAMQTLLDRTRDTSGTAHARPAVPGRAGRLRTVAARVLGRLRAA